jgi:putative ABC transport system permease protein
VKSRRGPGWRPPVDEEVEEELEFHVEMRAREYMARGLGAEEARRLARSRFGDIADVKAICRSQGNRRERSMRRAALWSEFRQDLRHAWWLLLRTPAATAVLVVTLGLGIGANTALFSVVKSVLLSPLPYAEPDDVVMLWSRWKDFPERTWVSTQEFQNYQQVVNSLSEMALIQQFETSITDGDAPERVPALAVTPELFDVLGVDAVVGRTFTAEDAVEGQPNRVLLTWGLWQRRHAGDPNVIGRTIETNGQTQTIVGVLPRDFRIPLDYRTATPAQLFFPITLPPFSGRLPQNGGGHGSYVIARMADGATVETVNTELRQLTTRLTADGIYPPDWNFGAFVISAPEEVAGALRPALLVLLGAVGFVLLIACANVANLLLVRSEDRRRELSVRAALGASGSRLVRQLLTENLLLAVAGGALGLALAFAGVRLLVAMAPATLPRLPEAGIDAGVLGFTAALAIFTALLFGLLPALHAARTDLQLSLKESGRANTSTAQRARFRQGMVMGQIALAVVLVAGAGLMLRSFSRMVDIDPGFDPDGVLTARLSAPAAFYETPADVNGFYDRVLAEVRRIPGVRHAGMIRVLPIDTEIGDSRVLIPGYVNSEGGSTVPADWQAASDGYFEAMGMRLVEGRFFTSADRIDAEQVIIVNEAFVNAYLGGGSALGQSLRYGFVDGVPMQRVVGVVANAKHNGITGETKATFYRPQQQWPVSTNGAARNMTLVMKVDGDPTALAATLRRTIGAIDPRLPISNVKTMDEVLSTALAQPRFTMALLVTFSGLALALALIGMYGVVSWVVAQRRHEMGIRMALGAQPRWLVWMTLRSAIVQTAVGIGLGVALAAGVTRAMSGLLFETSTHDPTTYLAVALLALVATLTASWIPARRAAHTDPLSAMRTD